MGSLIFGRRNKPVAQQLTRRHRPGGEDLEARGGSILSGMCDVDMEFAGGQEGKPNIEGDGSISQFGKGGTKRRFCSRNFFCAKQEDRGKRGYEKS